ncbi:MAG: flagellar export chaperone FliS [Steroidobacteraceae bacterium]
MTFAVQSRASAINSARSAREGGTAADSCGLARMLMDGALERIDAARGQGENGDGARTRVLLQSAVMIIGELRAHLDLRRGGAIAASVDELYDYMCRRLGGACLPKAIAALDEVSHLLDALHCAWAFMPAEVRRSAPGN